MRETLVDVGGWRLRVMEAGEGPTLLFLHGAGGLAWYPLMELLAKDWHVLAPEHPGFGKAEIPGWLTSVGDLAYFYLDAMKVMQLDGVRLAGHSLGGWTAAEIAIRSTALIRSVALLAPAGVPAETVSYGDIFLWSAEEHARNSFCEPALIEARLKALDTADLDVMLQNRAAAARLAWSPRLHNPQLPHWLHRIDVPALLVWGEEDRICPFALHRTFLSELPNAQLFALPRSGHALHTERPAEVAQRLTQFFAGARA